MGWKIKTDKIWICESVGKLKGIGKQREVKTNEVNIHTIAGLQRYVWSYGLPKLPICGLGRIYEHGLVALPVKPTPSIKDHKKAKNPYFSKYGDIWVENFKSSSSMSKFCCITDLIRFMMKEAEKLMKGSVHEDGLSIVSFDVFNTKASWTIKKSSSWTDPFIRFSASFIINQIRSVIQQNFDIDNDVFNFTRTTPLA